MPTWVKHFLLKGIEMGVGNRRGRPPSYDLDEVLDAAIRVFWTKGYEGASLDDLTNAMRLNRPSLYARFGNKHGLFLAALDRYIETHFGALMSSLMQEGEIRIGVEKNFTEIIRLVTTEEGPRGCLIASVAAEIAERDDEVRDKIANHYTQAEAYLEQRLAEEGHGRKSGGAVPGVTGAMIVSAGLSFAAYARLGASRSKLEEIAHGYINSFFALPPSKEA